MRKNSLTIYIAMIIVGVGILFFYMNRTETPPAPQVETTAQPKPLPPQQETIRIAVAKHDLIPGTILTVDDYQIKSLSIAKGGPEKEQYSIQYPSINNFAVAEPIAEGAYIPANNLVEPGTKRYISLFLSPDSVLYSFNISPVDSYLLDNLQPGEGVDIYLNYGKKSTGDGRYELVSPGTTIRETRFQLLMKNRRILALNAAASSAFPDPRKKGNTSGQDEANTMMLELTHSDVKLLKGLEGKSRLVFLPTGKGEEEKGTATAGAQAVWPVLDDSIFSNSPLDLELDDITINELRG